MSLAFALMAAINGSTGSSATLSHGLNGTKPRRRQSTAARILIPHGRRRKPSRTLSRFDSEHRVHAQRMAAAFLSGKRRFDHPFCFVELP